MTHRRELRIYFVDYHTLLPNHGLVCILEEKENLTIKQVLWSIWPSKLRSRLELDIAFELHKLINDF